MPRQHCSTSKPGRPHTVIQTAGFIHRLDKLCRRPHQLQPVSYPFTGYLHWWPDYSEQDTVKGTGPACWRSALGNVDTKTEGKEPDTVIHSSHFYRHITVKSGGAPNCKDKNTSTLNWWFVAKTNTVTLVTFINWKDNWLDWSVYVSPLSHPHTVHTRILTQSYVSSMMWSLTTLSGPFQG